MLLNRCDREEGRGAVSGERRDGNVREERPEGMWWGVDGGESSEGATERRTERQKRVRVGGGQSDGSGWDRCRVSVKSGTQRWDRDREHVGREDRLCDESGRFWVVAV